MIRGLVGSLGAPSPEPSLASPSDLGPVRQVWLPAIDSPPAGVCT
jgi:hypothetical protein